MKARKLIEGATYDPAQLKIIRQAFDAAWEEISPSVSSRAAALEASRFKLAKAVIAVAKDGAIEAERIKADALRVMFTQPGRLGFKVRA